MNLDTDFLVIGSGAAGLSFALDVADHARVVIATKAEINEGNTLYAQGGICSVTYDPDNFDKHIADTLVCGAGMCDAQVVDMVVRKAPAAIKQLIARGVKFDKDSTGKYELAREGGHTQYRILHHKDNTGHEIERALVSRVKQHKNIRVLEHHFAVDLLTQHHLGKLVRKSTPNKECYGAYVFDLNNQKMVTVRSKFTVLASGGVGNIYHTTTNPSVATGDGIAMVHRAKGAVENMEYIQFHPTALYNPGERPNYLITEAMRGFGAILKLPNGEEFMYKYHKMGSLAPRDITARGIDNEMKIHGYDYVNLDVTHKDPKETIAHFPNIYKKCLSEGIDITKDMIPVVPAAHYCVGGVEVDFNGQTTIKRLYALGETSSTGLHGANRLASNSLMEAVVYAQQAADHALPLLDKVDLKDGIPDWDYEGTSRPEEMVLITQNYKEMQQIMSNYVGIVRSDLRLERAKKRLEIIFKETEDLYLTSTLSQNLCELRNMIAVGYLIIKQAQLNKQSVGLHYSLDHPVSLTAKEF